MPATTLPSVPMPVAASLLESLSRSKHPRMDLPSFASNRSLTLDHARRVAELNGYPDQAAMAAAAAQLQRRPSSAAGGGSE